jgi:hypothetical protein
MFALIVVARLFKFVERHILLRSIKLRRASSVLTLLTFLTVMIRHFAQRLLPL